MKVFRAVVVLVLLCTVLAACGFEEQSEQIKNQQATLEKLQQRGTQAAGTLTAIQPTLAARPTATQLILPTLMTNTPTTALPGKLSVEIQGCTSSIDISHGLGEVTNAYIVLRNATNTAAANVCATLFASDEGKLHPDKMKCIPRLPANNQVALKLTVDTTYRENTLLKVVLTADGMVEVPSNQIKCSMLSVATEKALTAILNLVGPIK